MNTKEKQKKEFSWKKAVVIVMAIALLMIVGMSFYYNGTKSLCDVFTKTKGLENTYYLIQIIGGCALTIGAVIGIWQYVLTARSERRKLSMERVEKAVDLANYYKDEILSKYRALMYVYEKGGIKNELDNIKVRDMKEFTKEELTNNLSEAGQKKLEELIKSERVAKAIVTAEMMLGLELKLEKAVNIEYVDGKKTINVNGNMVIRRFMSGVVTRLLNNLEYFAMNFMHGIADETVVYQSLSKTYMELVQMLYYDIAKNNEIAKQQLYTNVTELYRKWYARHENDKKDARSSIKKGTVVDTAID